MDWGADPSAVRGPGEPAPDSLVDAVERAVVALQGDDPARLAPGALGDRVVRVESLLARLASHEVECVRVMDERGDAQVLGMRTTQSWLRAVARLAPSAARALVVLARRMGERAATAEAFAAGRIGLRHSQLLVGTIDEVAPWLGEPDDVARLEKDLVDLAERTDPLRLSDGCRRIRIIAAPERAVADDWVAFEQRKMSVSRTLYGMAAGDFLLDPSGAEPVMAAIHAFSRPAGSDDTRSPAQRRADALVEICRRVLAFSDTPVVGGERPHVLVTVPLETLEGRRGADPGELSWVGPVSGELVRRIACDATISRVVTDPVSLPLDVGRSTRVVTAGMRKALMVRDGHCQHPGCDIPAVWCDCHHLTHWALGGVTALHNLICLCGYHHTRLHLAGEWIRRRSDGTIEIIRDPQPDHHDHDAGPAP